MAKNGPDDAGSKSEQGGPTPEPAEVGEAGGEVTSTKNASVFDPRVLDKTVIALPLIKEMAEENPEPNQSPTTPRSVSGSPDVRGRSTRSSST